MGVHEAGWHIYRTSGVWHDEMIRCSPTSCPVYPYGCHRLMGVEFEAMSHVNSALQLQVQRRTLGGVQGRTLGGVQWRTLGGVGFPWFSFGVWLGGVACGAHAMEWRVCRGRCLRIHQSLFRSLFRAVRRVSAAVPACDDEQRKPGREAQPGYDAAQQREQRDGCAFGALRSETGNSLAGHAGERVAVVRPAP